VSDWHHFGVVNVVKYLLLAFFFGFVVDLVPLVELFLFVVLLPFVAFLPFVALLPMVDLETLTPFVAAALDPFALVLASCAARIAKSSCLLEQPVASKIRLIVGEVSSSIVAREEALDPCLVVALAVDERDGRAVVVDGFIGLIAEGQEFIASFKANGVGTFFLVSYGLTAVLRR